LPIRRSLIASACLSLALALAPALPASAQEKPPLSEEIRKAFEEGGVEAAEARYREILEGERDAWEFDAEAMMAIGSEYAQAGNMEGVQAFYTIGSQMAMAEFQSSDAGARFNAMMDSVTRGDEDRGGSEDQVRIDQAVASSEADGAAVSAAAGEVVAAGSPDQGFPRDDLDRFFGLYRDPNPPGTANRDLFVTRTCNGRLAIGAMWGDVAPYVMRSEGDTRFTQIWVSEFEPVPHQLDFELGPAGRATAVTHNVTAEYTFERWARVGDLPDGYEDCLDTETR
jgi:hypothetical protein